MRLLLLENYFLNLLINISGFLSLCLPVSVSLSVSVSRSLSFIPVHSMPPESQTHRHTHVLTHTARGYIQTTMVERTRGDGLWTDRVEAVHVTLGGYPVFSATALGNLRLLTVCVGVYVYIRISVFVFLLRTEGIPRSLREWLGGCLTGEDKPDQQPTAWRQFNNMPDRTHCLLCIKVDYVWNLGG